MPKEFLLPELAESVVEGEIVRWLVAEGEQVAEDQPIVEVMTDKVTVELPSPYSGVLEKHLAGEGEVVSVHHPIALFADDGEASAAEPAAGSESSGGQASTSGGQVASHAEAPGETGQKASGARPEEQLDDGDRLSLFRPSAEVDEGPTFRVKRRAEDARPGVKPKGPYGRVLAVPAARRLARELGVDIERVEGSGPNGRVRLDDVRAHFEAGGDGAAERGSGSVRPSAAVSHHTPAGLEEREERLPVRGLRRAISQQMVASHLQSVRTLHVDEADVTALVNMRGRLKAMAERRGVKLSYLPFVMKAAVAALKAFPVVNSSLDDDAGEIVMKRYYNLGLAVATDNGLVVPVIHDVDRKSVLELAQELQVKADRARSGKLQPADVRGGTFSITNIGSLGGLFSFPIINVPEAAILGVHSIKKRPVVLEDDTIAARQMLYLSLSFDHRIIDGAEAARFTSHLIELLETPEGLLLEV